jgi:hypothetical protein
VAVDLRKHCQVGDPSEDWQQKWFGEILRELEKENALLFLKLYLKGAPEPMLVLDKYFVEERRVTTVMGEQTRPRCSLLGHSPDVPSEATERPIEASGIIAERDTRRKSEGIRRRF